MAAPWVISKVSSLDGMARTGTSFPEILAPRNSDARDPAISEVAVPSTSIAKSDGSQPPTVGARVTYIYVSASVEPAGSSVAAVGVARESFGSRDAFPETTKPISTDCGFDTHVGSEFVLV